jgi:vacuolar-type H+-ATPase subunit F/Vma7
MVDQDTLVSIGIPRNRINKKLLISNEKAIAMHKFFLEHFKEDTKEIMRKDCSVLSISEEKFKSVRETLSMYNDAEFNKIIIKCPRILRRSTSTLSEILSILYENFGEKSKEIILKEPSVFTRSPNSIKEKINELKLYSKDFHEIVIKIPACICSYSVEKLKGKIDILLTF